VIDACPDWEWRLLVALARFGGFRVPSEATRLRWQDIDWDRERIKIRSPKAEHHKGKATVKFLCFPN
jgi:integrase